jgi:RsiW-degrading membrane proteinase PrsW (M82 family)
MDRERRRANADLQTLAALDRAATQSRSPFITFAGVFFALALACNVLIVIASVPDRRGIWLGLLAALLPTLGYAWLVISFDRYEREPWRNLLGAFGWGAVVATLFSILLSDLADRVLSATLGGRIGGALALTIGSPIIEESLKGLALLGLLLLFRHEFDGTLDGLIYGALIGLGFAMTENVLYLGQAYIAGGLGALGQLFIAREIFGGLGHALYSGTLGAAVGWARARYRRGVARFIVPLLGWALAIGQHSLWNLGASAIAARDDPTTPLLGLVAIQTLFFIVPGLGILAFIAVRSGRAESQILHEQLADEVANGILTQGEYEVLSGDRLRHLALLAALRRGGVRRWSLQQRFFQAAAELALCKHHNCQGEAAAHDVPWAPEATYRAQLAVLRAALVGD